MKNRIIEFLKIENISSAQFADEIGVQPSGISHIISGRNNPSLDFIMKMLTRYPLLSTDWLLFGKGEMYRKKQLNDLFNSKAEDSIYKDQENPFQGNLPPQNNGNEGELVDIDEDTVESGKNKSNRIVCFFGDGTFREYFPVQK